MENNIFVVDAFTAEPFAGNPAGVCLLDEWPESQWMQSLAAEMRHSETAFLVKSGDGDYHLRWFTPAVEMDLCGHATLASAHVLYHHGFEPETAELRFQTRSGKLRASLDSGKIRLDFPASIPKSTEIDEKVREIFGFDPLFAGISDSDFFLVVAPDEKAVLATQPTDDAMMNYPQHGIVVTAQADREGVDVVSRMFGPRVGIHEDPVTGSAHCVIAPYWTAKLGKPELTCLQASERGGMMVTRMEGDRVALLGDSVTILAGRLGV